jgi:hypothetical protein
MKRLDFGEKVIGITALVVFAATTINIVKNNYHVKNNFRIKTKKEISIYRKELKYKSYDEFIQALAMRESSNRPYIVNEYGYVGLFQMGKLAMLDIGYTEGFYENVVQNPEEWTVDQQIEDFNKWKNILKLYLEDEISMYNGKYIHGVKITESGLIAAAHLVGAGSVKKWIRTGEVSADGNGVKLTEYLTQFNGYELA